MERFIIGMDIGGTNVRIGAISKENCVHHFQKVYQKDIFVDDNSLDHLIHFIENFISEHALAGKIDGISIAMPATINKEGTTVMQAPSLVGFDNLNIVSPLEKYFGIKTILLKDVWTAAVYDIEKYHINCDGVVAACYIGTGLGNVLLIDGEIYKGKNGVSGELGHIPVIGDGTPCGCGNIGCIENYAGGKYLAKICEEQNTDVTNVFKDGDPKEIERYMDSIAVAVATEINILDPDQILLGGGVLQMEGFSKELLENRIREHTRKPYPEKNLCICYVGDDPEKGVIGAAMYARKTEEKYA